MRLNLVLELDDIADLAVLILDVISFNGTLSEKWRVNKMSKIITTKTLKQYELCSSVSFNRHLKLLLNSRSRSLSFSTCSSRAFSNTNSSSSRICDN